MDEQGRVEEIDDYLRSLGATDEQIWTGWRESRIVPLAGDLVVAEGAHLTGADLAVRANAESELVLSLWHALGVAVPDGDTPMFTESDAELTCFLIQENPVGSDGHELLRVLGASLARVAEAAVSLYVQTQEPTRDARDADLLTWSKELVAVSQAALRLGDSMGSIFSHHLRDAIDRQRVAQIGVSERALYRLAVGFVDLVGFTPLSLHTDPVELLALVSDFEDKAFEVASKHDGRIVKHIGDEVMFVALDASSACAIAQEITATFGDGIEPRGGVSFGPVIARHGDYYGKVVNLASRLADLAVPSEVLVDAETVESAGERVEFRPAGKRLLKGYDNPVEVFSVSSVSVTAG